MVQNFLNRIKTFITSPSDGFKAERKTSFKDSLIYALEGILLLSVLSGFMYGLMIVGLIGDLGLFANLLIIVAVFITSFLILFLIFLILFLIILWFHLWLYVFGARKGLTKTAKAFFFGYTPSYILGWIPFVSIITGIWSITFVSIITGIWSIILVGLGLKEFHNLSTGKIIGAVLLAIFSPLIIISAIIFAIIIGL